MISRTPTSSAFSTGRVMVSSLVCTFIVMNVFSTPLTERFSSPVIVTAPWCG